MSLFRDRIATTLLATALAAAAPLQAQSPAFGFSPYSGDAEFDARLEAVSALAAGDLEGFVTQLALSYAVPREEARTLIVERHYPPDYVWLAAASTQALGRDWHQVFPVFEQHRGQGWGAIAKELGIKPGSPAFHALKGELERTHARAGKHRPAKTAPPGHAPAKGQGTGKAKAKGKEKSKGKQR